MQLLEHSGRLLWACRALYRLLSQLDFTCSLKTQEKPSEFHEELPKMFSSSFSTNGLHG